MNKLVEMISARPEWAAELIKQLLAELVLEDFDSIDHALKSIDDMEARAWSYSVFEQTCVIAAGGM